MAFQHSNPGNEAISNPQWTDAFKGILRVGGGWGNVRSVIRKLAFPRSFRERKGGGETGCTMPDLQILKSRAGRVLTFPRLQPADRGYCKYHP